MPVHVRFFLIVSAAAEGAGLDASEALERADARLVEHVAAAEDHLNRMSGSGAVTRTAGVVNEVAAIQARQHLVVVSKLLFADGAGKRAVVAAPRFLLHVRPFLWRLVTQRQKQRTATAHSPLTSKAEGVLAPNQACDILR